MTTTTTFQGLEPGSKSSSRVLRPPGGGSNISFGNDEEKPSNRKNKMASSIFAEPDDPHANRRNNPPGGKPTGVLCGESSAPLRRCHAAAAREDGDDTKDMVGETHAADSNHDTMDVEYMDDLDVAQEKEEAASASAPTSQPSGVPSGRRNPPGGKSSLILG
ncbi:jupiter microtubule associated homolog 1a [Denticeps clupeoides]|uniref:Uncharacterized protein n=1 Tax=Denticeps clupeoides TaxID=299321 RepID=A0AAY4C5N0_9TELE|nr:jupiter microtubule associated homolog 1 [Denticeps clupeoides]